MPNARASSPTRRPIRPRPTMPIVLPASSMSGVLRRREVRLTRPFARRGRPPRAWRRDGTAPGAAQTQTGPPSCVPYTGTFETGMPRRRAAATSTQSNPVAIMVMNRSSGSSSISFGGIGALFVTSTAAPRARMATSSGARERWNSTSPSLIEAGPGCAIRGQGPSVQNDDLHGSLVPWGGSS